ncbi:MAG: hypothetical protein PHR44_06835 [Candidatus Omnitrophica bacterium]|nr:hypothetical protein [Candidatus Omnitrophota bacterium]
MGKVLLFNPVSIVHARNMGIFREFLPDWTIRCIYNRRLPWFSDMDRGSADEVFYFKGRYFPKLPQGVFDGVSALVLFTSQPRIPPCHLIQEATLRRIPVIAIEEVYQMMLHQGLLNNYLLPVDRLLVASDYERLKFIETGIAPETIETTGCISGYSRRKPPSQLNKLKGIFGLSNRKHTATLCLDAISSDANAGEVCSKLIACVTQGLPESYELLIKPHPEDRKDDFAVSLRRHSPRAKIADSRMPIDEILDITDILLNRGNSQVIIDALQRDIPVAVIPLGRKTFFHGLLDEAIINDHRDLERLLKKIEMNSRDLYTAVRDNISSFSPRESLERVVSCIIRIAAGEELYRPEERLIELAFFWAWMGYASYAEKTLFQAEGGCADKDFIGKAHSLVRCRDGREDLPALREWAGNGYREWLIQSLWVKSRYLNRDRLSRRDREWLIDFPPVMERSRFLDYAVLLYWCYLDSGMKDEADMLMSSLCGEFKSTESLRRLNALNLTENGALIFNIRYLISRLKYNSALALKDPVLRNLRFIN